MWGTFTSENEHTCKYCPEPIKARTPYVYLVEPFLISGERKMKASKAHPECVMRRKHVARADDN